MAYPRLLSRSHVKVDSWLMSENMVSETTLTDIDYFTVPRLHCSMGFRESTCFLLGAKNFDSFELENACVTSIQWKAQSLDSNGFTGLHFSCYRNMQLELSLPWLGGESIGSLCVDFSRLYLFLFLLLNHLKCISLLGCCHKFYLWL